MAQEGMFPLHKAGLRRANGHHAVSTAVSFRHFWVSLPCSPFLFGWVKLTFREATIHAMTFGPLTPQSVGKSRR